MTILSRSLILSAPQQLCWQTIELSEPGPNELLIETIRGAISLGTELPIYWGTHRGDPLTFPRMTGYENVGRVLARGAAVTDVVVGQRVLGFYGHRTHALLPREQIVPLPTDVAVDVDLALLAILGCDAAKGVSKLALPAQQPCLITGAGTMGLLALFNLMANGNGAVDVVEPLAGRRALATGLGARHCFASSTAMLAHAARAPYANGIECSSRDAAFGVLQRALHEHGTLCVLADGNREPLTLLPAFHTKELVVAASSDGLDYAEYAAWFLHAAPAQSQQLTALFEESTSFEQLAAWFAATPHRKALPVKVLVHYAETAMAVR